MNTDVEQCFVREWEHVPGNGFNHGWRCPICMKTVWLDLGISPDDCDMHYCTCCGEPLMEHGGTFIGWKPELEPESQK